MDLKRHLPFLMRGH